MDLSLESNSLMGLYLYVYVHCIHNSVFPLVFKLTVYLPVFNASLIMLVSQLKAQMCLLCSPENSQFQFSKCQ